MEGELKQIDVLLPSWSWWQKIGMSSCLEESLLISYPPVKKKGNGNTKYYKQARHKPSTNIKIIYMKSKACVNIQQEQFFFLLKGRCRLIFCWQLGSVNSKSPTTVQISGNVSAEMCVWLFSKLTTFYIRHSRDTSGFLSASYCLASALQNSAMF